MRSPLDSQSSRLASHLTDEQFADLLLGTKLPAVRTHLDTCPKCSQEAERMSAAIGSFQQLSSAWAERRVATAEPLRAADARRFSLSHRPLAWSAAALAIALTAGFGLSRHADQRQQAPQPVALTEPAVPTATLQSDNQLLSAIDGYRNVRPERALPWSTGETGQEANQRMRLVQFHFVRAAIVGLCLAAGTAVTVQAQGGGRGGGPPGGGGPGGGGPGRGGMGGGGMNGGMGDQNRSGFPGGGSRPSLSPESIPSRNSNGEAPVRAGLQFGPPGQRWWDDRGFVKNLKLRPDQQARMDAIFEQNRNLLVSRIEGLQQAQAEMEQLSSSSSPDESALYAQIDRVAQARAELEKANTHLLLQLRNQMDADQIKRLEKSR